MSGGLHASGSNDASTNPCGTSFPLLPFKAAIRLFPQIVPLILLALRGYNLRRGFFCLCSPCSRKTGSSTVPLRGCAGASYDTLCLKVNNGGQANLGGISPLLFKEDQFIVFL